MWHLQKCLSHYVNVCPSYRLISFAHWSIPLSSSTTVQSPRDRLPHISLSQVCPDISCTWKRYVDMGIDGHHRQIYSMFAPSTYLFESVVGPLSLFGYCIISCTNHTTWHSSTLMISAKAAKFETSSGPMMDLNAKQASNVRGCNDGETAV